MVTQSNPKAVCLLVFNEDTRNILVVGRKENSSFIGLPGGKVDENETLPQALIREVFEETGLVILEKDITLLFSDIDKADQNSTEVSTYLYTGSPPLIVQGSLNKEGLPIFYKYLSVIFNPAFSPFYEYNIKMFDVFVEKYYDNSINLSRQ